MNIPFNRLDALFAQHQSEYEDAALRALRSGWYVLGKEVEEFEAAFAARIGSKHCVTLNSGLDALVLALNAVDVGAGDEVIVPANTYIATVLAITRNGATPVFVEPDEYYHIDTDLIESAITPRTKAILPVHLYGQAGEMQPIVELAKKHNLFIVEDCAQSHLATIEGKMTGTFGNIGCFSFFPTKNLGAFGDAGAVVTDDGALAAKMRKLRNYGSERKYYNELMGVNSRMDELQAALLRVRLPYLEEIIAERTKIASYYLEHIHTPKVELPQVRPKAQHTWHLFAIRTERRDALAQHLADQGISTQVHYPVPPHLAQCYEHLGYSKGSFPVTERYADTILSLPLYNGMREKEMQYVVAAINGF